ncbi:hypothetical protein [Streptomyces sp. CB03238]|uniref:hypothetical protein n=1 Tax=Streptomyces sp. CB03238 TaxID=1907777 RepID=UPI000A0FA675|nr:hypothetical protein [Streptomyces sp. CB03238]ORT59513.1 hypothetical protein BKD26_11335 [Streptomyces sp. CB03238]
MAESDGGPAVIRVSDVLVTSLAPACVSQIDELGQWWAEEKADEGLDLDPEAASTILYCWVS